MAWVGEGNTEDVLDLLHRTELVLQNKLQHGLLRHDYLFREVVVANGTHVGIVACTKTIAGIKL